MLKITNESILFKHKCSLKHTVFSELKYIQYQARISNTYHFGRQKYGYICKHLYKLSKNSLRKCQLEIQQNWIYFNRGDMNMCEHDKKSDRFYHNFRIQWMNGRATEFSIRFFKNIFKQTNILIFWLKWIITVKVSSTLEASILLCLLP